MCSSRLSPVDGAWVPPTPRLKEAWLGRIARPGATVNVSEKSPVLYEATEMSGCLSLQGGWSYLTSHNYGSKNRLDPWMTKDHAFRELTV